MESAELVRVGPEASAEASAGIYVDTIVASSGSSSSDWGVRQVVDEAGDGDSSSSREPRGGVAGRGSIGAGMYGAGCGAGADIEGARGRAGRR